VGKGGGIRLQRDEKLGEISVVKRFFGEEKSISDDITIFTLGEQPRCHVEGCYTFND
jgi:hypothetical protein